MGRDIIVIRASVGGVEALWTLMHALPAHFPASGFVVLHIPAHKPRLQLERFQEFKSVRWERDAALPLIIMTTIYRFAPSPLR